MGTPVIVETQVRAERGGAASRAGERVSIGPFTEQRLNEALGLAVGARRIGPRKPMPQLPRATDAREAPRFVARPVVGADPPRADASATKPGQRVLEKRGAGAPALGAADLHIRQAGGVIDRDVRVLIADPAPPFRLVTVNAMPHAVNAGQRFDIEMQEVSRVRPLIALNHRRWIEAAHAIQARSVQDAGHGRARHPDALANLPGGRALLALRQNRRGARHVEAAGLSMRPRRPIFQLRVPLSGPPDPFRDRAHTDA